MWIYVLRVLKCPFEHARHYQIDVSRSTGLSLIGLVDLVRPRTFPDDPRLWSSIDTVVEGVDVIERVILDVGRCVCVTLAFAHGLVIVADRDLESHLFTTTVINLVQGKD
jgi:hypothetical protein